MDGLYFQMSFELECIIRFDSIVSNLNKECFSVYKINLALCIG